MAVSGLVDTGAILALLDRDDRWHQACVEGFASLRLPLLTSSAVLTELFHLVGTGHAMSTPHGPSFVPARCPSRRSMERIFRP